LRFLLEGEMAGVEPVQLRVGHVAKIRPAHPVRGRTRRCAPRQSASAGDACATKPARPDSARRCGDSRARGRSGCDAPGPVEELLVEQPAVGRDVFDVGGTAFVLRASHREGHASTSSIRRRASRPAKVRHFIDVLRRPRRALTAAPDCTGAAACPRRALTRRCAAHRRRNACAVPAPLPSPSR
jgi:hypothetical protein